MNSCIRSMRSVPGEIFSIIGQYPNDSKVNHGIYLAVILSSMTSFFFMYYVVWVRICANIQLGQAKIVVLVIKSFMLHG